MKKRDDKFIVLKSLIKYSYKIPHTESIYFDPKLDVKKRILFWVSQSLQGKDADLFKKSNKNVTTTKDVELYFEEICIDKEAHGDKNIVLNKDPFAIVNFKGNFQLMNKQELLLTVKKS